MKRSRWPTTRYMLSFCVFAFLLSSAGVEADAQDQPQPPCQSPAVPVPPGVWVGTGIQLKRGQEVGIKATGALRYKDGPRIDFGPGGDVYGMWSLKARVGSQIVVISRLGYITANEEGQLELGAPAREDTPVEEGLTSLDAAYHYCATTKVSGLPTVRITSTQSCTPEDNQGAKILGSVKITIGGRSVTTDAAGNAELQLEPGEYRVTASWQDAVLGYVYQAGELFRPSSSSQLESGYKINVRNNSESVEVRMLTCDQTGQPKARARISEIGSSSSMTVRIIRADGTRLEQQAPVGLVLRDGDILYVKGTGKLDWIEGGNVSFLNPYRETAITIGPTRPGDVPNGVSILRGVIDFWFNPGKETKEKFGAGTDTVVVGVKGTKFRVGYDEQTRVSSVEVQEGEVEIIPRNRSLQGLILRAGQHVDVAETWISPVQPASTTTVATTNPNFGPLHEGEDLFDAGDYRSFNISEPRVQICLDECAKDPQCKSVTYTKPGTYGNPLASCWFKERPGRFGPHANAISAIKVQSTNVERTGGTAPNTSGTTQSTSGTTQRTGGQQLIGNWLFRGIAGQNCTIENAGQNKLKFVTERGSVGSGFLESATVFVVDFPFARGLHGELSADGNRINWANGEFWIRSN